MCCRSGLPSRHVTSRHVVYVSVPLFHVTAVVGEAVYLPCNITTDAGDAVLLVLWYREDLGTPIYRSVKIQYAVCLICHNVSGRREILSRAISCIYVSV